MVSEGNELRERGPAYLLRGCLRDGEIVVGLRNADEVGAARAERLIDLFVWVERDVSPAPPQTFGAELCDLVLLNTGTLTAFYARLQAPARFGNLPPAVPVSEIGARRPLAG